jgi:hypothetical protein
LGMAGMRRRKKKRRKESEMRDRGINKRRS